MCDEAFVRYVFMGFFCLLGGSVSCQKMIFVNIIWKVIDLVNIFNEIVSDLRWMVSVNFLRGSLISVAFNCF
jgi:hypothetical protein